MCDAACMAHNRPSKGGTSVERLLNVTRQGQHRGRSLMSIRLLTLNCELTDRHPVERDYEWQFVRSAGHGAVGMLTHPSASSPTRRTLPS